MEHDTYHQLTLPAAMQAEIIAHAREGWPDEVCGILSGKDGAAISLVRARNVAEDRQINTRWIRKPCCASSTSRRQARR